MLTNYLNKYWTFTPYPAGPQRGILRPKCRFPSPRTLFVMTLWGQTERDEHRWYSVVLRDKVSWSLEV
jgi:hypothetical protein